MYGSYGEYCCMVSIIPFGIVWYLSKHEHKENLGTFGSVVGRLEALWKRLRFRRFGGVWERLAGNAGLAA